MAEGSDSKPRRKRSKRSPEQASVEDLVAALDAREDADAADAEAADAAHADEAEADAAGADAPADETAANEPHEPGADGDVPDTIQLSDTLPMAPEDDLSEVEGEASGRLVSIVESLLFAADRPMTVKDIRRLLKDPSVRQIQLALKQLIKDTADRGIVLGQVAGGFRLRTNPENAPFVQRMLAGRPARLSRSQLEALALIAYRQPITKPEIDHVRGVDCNAVLKVLLERDLVRIVGRKEEPGRPILYGTTVQFLEFFNLRSLRDMPDLHEFRELTEESRATLREHYGDAAEEVEAEALGQQTLGLDADGDADAGDAAAEGDDTEADVDDDHRAEASADAEDDGEVDTEADGDAVADAEVDTEADAEVDTEADDDVGVEADDEVDTEADDEVDTEADDDAHAGDAVTDAEVDVDAEVDADPEGER